jgi:hypothetical protein
LILLFFSARVSSRFDSGKNKQLFFVIHKRMIEITLLVPNTHRPVYQSTLTLVPTVVQVDRGNLLARNAHRFLQSQYKAINFALPSEKTYDDLLTAFPFLRGGSVLPSLPLGVYQLFQVSTIERVTVLGNGQSICFMLLSLDIS